MARSPSADRDRPWAKEGSLPLHLPPPKQRQRLAKAVAGPGRAQPHAQRALPPPIHSAGPVHFHPLIRYIYFSGISLTRIDCTIIAYFFGPLAVNLEAQRAEAGRPSLSGLTPAAPRAAMTTATDVSHAARAPRTGKIDLATAPPRTATDLPSVPGSIICFI